MDATVGFCHDLMLTEGFAILVTTDEKGETVTTHLPVFLDEHRGQHGSLIVDVSWGTSAFSHFVSGHPAVALFHGPRTRVTPGRGEDRAGDIWTSVTVRASGVAHLVDERPQNDSGAFVATFEIPIDKLDAHVVETPATEAGPLREAKAETSPLAVAPADDLWGAVAALMSLSGPSPV